MKIKLIVDNETGSYEISEPKFSDLEQALNELKKDYDNILTIQCASPINHVMCIQGTGYEYNNLTALVFVADNADKEQEYGFQTELSTKDFFNMLKGFVVNSIAPNVNGWDIIWSAEEERQETQQYLELAQTGNAEAQYCIGSRYFNGEGIQQDYFEAVKWLRKAAEQNIPHAQIALSFCYRDGKGVERSEDAAANCIEKAIIQATFSNKFSLNRAIKSPNAEFHVFSIIPWIEQLAEQNNVVAQYCMGMIFKDGIWCKKDTEVAVKWLTKAAKQGHAYAQYSLGICYFNIDEIRNIDTALVWITKAAENGIVYAQCCLGNEYYYEQENFPEAFKWYKKAAEQGYALAQYHLGVCYRDKKAIKNGERYRDYDEAIKWFEKAAAQGHLKAKEWAEKLQALPIEPEIFDWEGQQVKFVKKHLLSADGKTALVFCINNFNTKSFTVPSGIKRIANGAFRCGRFLETITIPTSVKEIESRAFTVYTKGTYKGKLWPKIGPIIPVLDTENYELCFKYSPFEKCFHNLTTIIYKGTKQQWNEKFYNVKLDGITLICQK